MTSFLFLFFETVIFVGDLSDDGNDDDDDEGGLADAGCFGDDGTLFGDDAVCLADA